MIPHANRSIPCAMAILGLLGLGAWASPAAAQLPPWQQPPAACQPGPADSPAASHDLAPGLDTPEDSSESWAGEEYEQDSTPFGLRRGFLCDALHDRFWAKGEFLAWWTKGFATPPLLTTGSQSNPLAGFLGQTDTTVLAGGKDLEGGFHPGVRITLGAWLDACQTWGVEGSYLQLSRQTTSFNASGTTVPVLMRPFFNVESAQQDALTVSFPGQQSGTFNATSSTQLGVAELLARKNVNRQPGFSFDIVAGYRYQQLEDHLGVNDTLTFSGSQGAFPNGSVVQQADTFDTRNVFQGGELGMSVSLHRQWWSIDALLKIAAGQTNSRVTISGTTITSIPGQTTTLASGGVLALSSNIGIYDSERFSVVPELGLTLGMDLAPQVRATLGYDLLYWDAVARPGEQIDLNIDPRQFPPPAITNGARPQFVLHTSDYWAQGINLGLDFRF
jgi:hypothetical protein